MDYRKKISLLFEEPFDKNEIYSLLARPKEEKMGDFALPCFTLAKKAGENPMALAKRFSETLKKPSFLESIEPAGGFLNFKIKKKISKLVTYSFSFLFLNWRVIGVPVKSKFSLNLFSKYLS